MVTDMSDSVGRLEYLFIVNEEFGPTLEKWDRNNPPKNNWGQFSPD